MQRQKKIYALTEGQHHNIKRGMLNWVQQFSILLFLDTNDYPSANGSYECLLAAGALPAGPSAVPDELFGLFEWHSQRQDWLFGHICYDYKNVLEPRLHSSNGARCGFPMLSFFCPEVVCHISSDKSVLTIESAAASPDTIFREISNASADRTSQVPALTFRQRTDQGTYLSTIDQLRQHIKDGDCYEINFCTEGYCEGATLSPAGAFNKLNGLSPAPFAAYYRMSELYMMCASPERYLRKRGNRIMSQPIKGTWKRDKDHQKDRLNKQMLQKSIKERAENVMIVDLVRNDLARSCYTGSITVDELFGIYSFPQVHQMISTVSGQLNRNLPFTDALRYSFPMGSMTGTPKIKVMELIDAYEPTRRELFSGTVGYISPQGDFDFNVIIRSLFYNAATKYLSYHTGGAITYDSDPMLEWEEMRLKAWALERAFS